MQNNYQDDVQSLYVGLLGRAADPAGLEYWSNELSTGAISLEQLRANIVNEQPEYHHGIGSETRSEAVQSIYANLFNRDPEPEGHSYWVSGSGKEVNFDQLVLALLQGAGQEDTGALNNRVEVANTFSEAIGPADSFNLVAARMSLEDVGAKTSDLAYAQSRAEELAQGIIGPDANTPPPPEGVEVVSMFGGNFVTWDLPWEEYPDLDAAYIYRSDTPSVETSSLVAIENGFTYFDEDPTIASQDSYYWVSFVSTQGTEGAKQQASGEVPAQPIPSFDDSVDSIMDDIEGSPLQEELNKGIDPIELDVLGTSDMTSVEIA